ncbi:MAG: protein kinase [bacterium]
MGSVRDSTKTVSIKVLHEKYSQDKELVAAFHKCAENCGSITGQNQIRALEHGQRENRHYVIYKYYDLLPLEKLLGNNEVFDLNEALEFIENAARILRNFHIEGMVHGFLTPQNIFVDSDCKTIRISDFGFQDFLRLLISKKIKSNMHTYFSPETLAGLSVADRRSDIFSLGVLFYQMVVGDVPWQATDHFEASLQSSPLSMVPPSLHRLEIPDFFDDLIFEMLEADVEKRFQNISQMIDKIYEMKAALLASITPVSAELIDEEPNSSSKPVTQNKLYIPIPPSVDIELKNELAQNDTLPEAEFIEQKQDLIKNTLSANSERTSLNSNEVEKDLKSVDEEFVNETAEKPFDSSKEKNERAISTETVDSPEIFSDQNEEFDVLLTTDNEIIENAKQNILNHQEKVEPAFQFDDNEPAVQATSEKEAVAQENLVSAQRTSLDETPAQVEALTSRSTEPSNSHSSESFTPSTGENVRDDEPEEKSNSEITATVEAPVENPADSHPEESADKLPAQSVSEDSAPSPAADTFNSNSTSSLTSDSEFSTPNEYVPPVAHSETGVSAESPVDDYAAEDPFLSFANDHNFMEDTATQTEEFATTQTLNLYRAPLNRSNLLLTLKILLLTFIPLFIIFILVFFAFDFNWTTKFPNFKRSRMYRLIQSFKTPQTNQTISLGEKQNNVVQKRNPAKSNKLSSPAKAASENKIPEFKSTTQTKDGLIDPRLKKSDEMASKPFVKQETSGRLLPTETNGGNLKSNPRGNLPASRVRTVKLNIIVRRRQVPQTADVYINGQFIGKTNRNGILTIPELKPRVAYLIKVQSQGFEMWAKEVTLNRTRSVNLLVELMSPQP